MPLSIIAPFMSPEGSCFNKVYTFFATFVPFKRCWTPYQTSTPGISLVMMHNRERDNAEIEVKSSVRKELIDCGGSILQ